MTSEPTEGWLVNNLFEFCVAPKTHYSLEIQRRFGWVPTLCKIGVWAQEVFYGSDWPDDHPHSCKTCLKLKVKRDKEPS